MIADSLIAAFAARYAGHDPWSMLPLQGDASTRRYFRLSAGSTACIVCHDPLLETVSPDAYPFFLVHALLHDHAIRVPAILASEPEHGLLLLEDCGDLLLQDLVPALSSDEILLRYQGILEQLVSLQAIRGPSTSLPFSLAFDHEKLMFEWDFFIEHALRGMFRELMNEKVIAQFRQEVILITDNLVRPDRFVLNHRDFHSRNIMIVNDQPVFIDFQDARMGLPQYDAVSLLRDSYVSLQPEHSTALRDYHASLLRQAGLSSMSTDEYLYYYYLMAFQRNIKAIGTFCYQIMVRENRQFASSITTTLRYIPDYLDALPELRAAGALLAPLLERS